MLNVPHSPSKWKEGEMVQRKKSRDMTGSDPNCFFRSVRMSSPIQISTDQANSTCCKDENKTSLPSPSFIHAVRRRAALRIKLVAE